MKQHFSEILLGLLAALLAVVSFYLYTVQKAKEAALGAIGDAEEKDRLGKEKMHLAVQNVYAVIPAVLRPIFTPALLEQLIQPIFEKMKAYAEKKYGGKST